MPLTSRRTVMGRKRYKTHELVAKLRRACGDRHRLEAADVFARSAWTDTATTAYWSASVSQSRGSIWARRALGDGLTHSYLIHPLGAFTAAAANPRTPLNTCRP